MNRETRGKLCSKLKEAIFDIMLSDHDYLRSSIENGFGGINSYSDEELINEYQILYAEEFDESEFVKGN